MAKRERDGGMTDADADATRLDFAEEFALVYELDLPRTAGKVLGYLLVCDPAVQSQGQLADTLSASRGSISTMLRLLERFGWVERVSLPGERQVGYRVRNDAWTRHVEVHLERARVLHAVAQKAHDLLGEHPGETDRIDMTLDFAEFWTESVPTLIEQWRARNEERVAASKGRHTVTMLRERQKRQATAADTPARARAKR